MISLQIQILILFVIGYLLSKKGYFSKQTRTQLTNMVIMIFLPCSIVKSFIMELNYEIFMSTLSILVISFVIQLFYACLNKVIYNKYEDNKKVSLQYGTMVSNAGFMGMPIAEAVFGPVGLLLASVFLIPQRIFMWSSGLSLYAKGSQKNVVKEVMMHPCIIAMYIGVIVMIITNCGVVLPNVVVTTLSTLSNCTTALSMIVIGGILSDVDIKSVRLKDPLLYSGLRLIILPFMIYICLKALGVSSLTLGVSVLLSAMPAASTTVMLAQKYNRSPEFASQLVFVSTVLSLITLPLVTCFL